LSGKWPTVLVSQWLNRVCSLSSDPTVSSDDIQSAYQFLSIVLGTDTILRRDLKNEGLEELALLALHDLEAAFAARLVRDSSLSSLKMNRTEQQYLKLVRQAAADIPGAEVQGNQYVHGFEADIVLTVSSANGETVVRDVSSLFCEWAISTYIVFNVLTSFVAYQY